MHGTLLSVQAQWICPGAHWGLSERVAPLMGPSHSGIISLGLPAKGHTDWHRPCAAQSLWMILWES